MPARWARLRMAATAE
uniref:Uncharacterized protein n=1 Tax=Arundo donax TaxID=35708 RepID=A0A0A9HCW5_ARUDO